MHVRRNLNCFVVPFKAGLHAFILSKRMKLADKEVTTSDQYARGLTKNETEILNMLEHEIAGDQIGPMIFNWPWLRDIRNYEHQIIKCVLLSGLLDHRRREIDRLNLLTDLAQKRSVLSSPTADLENRLAATIIECLSRDLFVQIAREISITIIG